MPTQAVTCGLDLQFEAVLSQRVSNFCQPVDDQYIHQQLPGMNMQRKTALFHKELSIKALDMLKLVPLFD